MFVNDEQQELRRGRFVWRGHWGTTSLCCSNTKHCPALSRDAGHSLDVHIQVLESLESQQVLKNTYDIFNEEMHQLNSSEASVAFFAG